MVGYHGFDGGKVLLVNDLDLAKQVFVKDFDHFVDRRKRNFGNVYFENAMFFAEGEAWDAIQCCYEKSPTWIWGSSKIRSLLRGHPLSTYAPRGIGGE